MTNLKKKSVIELLGLHVDIMKELRAYGVLRSANNPTGDLAEYLFCEAFGWQRAGKEQRGFDATGKDGTRYQIKGRRIDNYRKNSSRRLSSIKYLEDFSVLAGVLFDDDYQIKRAALIPVDIVRANRTKSNAFHLRDSVWEIPNVTDVTKEVRIALKSTEKLTANLK